MDDDDDASEDESPLDGTPDFNYILSMPLWNLTKEKKDDLCRQRDNKVSLRSLARSLSLCLYLLFYIICLTWFKIHTWLFN